tara:strand:- start:281 stop:445 length:165 start_codon:yes stop_codon:yes gene_type:complete
MKGIHQISAIFDLSSVVPSSDYIGYVLQVCSSVSDRAAISIKTPLKLLNKIRLI